MAAGLYYSHAACLRHDPRELMPGHPDTPERLVVLERELGAREWLGWERREAPAAKAAELALVHDRELVAGIQQLCERGGGAIDGDTCVGAGSWEAALRAAGGAAEMTRALLAEEHPPNGERRPGYCAIRPSGHHAESARAMGFCLFNNVAVAAAVALAELGLRRVLVLDWDVHHGNGTEEIFYGRDDVLFVSLHQRPLYPGTGALEDSGVGAGEGHTINLPVPPGADERLWLALLDEVVVPAARSYAPELVLVSAGFDAHERDPLASCELETQSFTAIAGRVRDLAAELDVPVGVVQEGGYDAAVLAECVATTMEALSAAPGELTEPPGLGPNTDPVVARALEQYRRWWPLG